MIDPKTVLNAGLTLIECGQQCNAGETRLSTDGWEVIVREVDPEIQTLVELLRQNDEDSEQDIELDALRELARQRGYECCESCDSWQPADAMHMYEESVWLCHTCEPGKEKGVMPDDNV